MGGNYGAIPFRPILHVCSRPVLLVWPLSRPPYDLGEPEKEWDSWHSALNMHSMARPAAATLWTQVKASGATESTLAPPPASPLLAS